MMFFPVNHEYLEPPDVVNGEQKSESILKDTENKPGADVSVEQLQSSKSVLVPQFSGKITGARI